MNKIYLYSIGIIVLLILGGAAFFFLTSNTEINQTYEAVGSGEPTGGGVVGGNFTPEATIVRTNDGYEPKGVTINQGDTVSFTNESDAFHWPASDVHPTHQIYSDFDPRTPIGPGETWSFTFMEAGEWVFHDHLRANLRGKVIVQPAE